MLNSVKNSTSFIANTTAHLAPMRNVGSLRVAGSNSADRGSYLSNYPKISPHQDSRLIFCEARQDARYTDLNPSIGYSAFRFRVDEGTPIRHRASSLIFLDGNPHKILGWVPFFTIRHCLFRGVLSRSVTSSTTQGAGTLEPPPSYGAMDRSIKMGPVSERHPVSTGGTTMSLMSHSARRNLKGGA